MAKKTTETKNIPSKKKPASKEKAVSKKATVAVLKKSTQPKVVVETKSLLKEREVQTSYPQTKKEKKLVIKILLGIITIITLINGILLCYAISLIKEQREFTIASYGGKENYQMLKNLYTTAEFKQVAATNTYQLIDQVNQMTQQ
jgi:hypothetical protein